MDETSIQGFSIFATLPIRRRFFDALSRACGAAVPDRGPGLALRLLVCAAAVLLIASPLPAATYYWEVPAGQSSSWSNAVKLGRNEPLDLQRHSLHRQRRNGRRRHRRQRLQLPLAWQRFG